MLSSVTLNSILEKKTFIVYPISEYTFASSAFLFALWKTLYEKQAKQMENNETSKFQIAIKVCNIN